MSSSSPSSTDEDSSTLPKSKSLEEQDASPKKAVEGIDTTQSPTKQSSAEEEEELSSDEESAKQKPSAQSLQEEEDSLTEEKGGSKEEEEEAGAREPSTEEEEDSSSSEQQSSSEDSPDKEDDEEEEQQVDELKRSTSRGRRKEPPEYYDEILWNVPNKNREEYQGPMVNWTTMSNRKWASESLLRYLPHPEVDKLIGWAHHHDGASNNTSSPPNPLLDCEPNGPPPLSHLKYLQKKAQTIVLGKYNSVTNKAKGKKSNDCRIKRFDTSAAVALGMVLEEMITANLLPLAELHVQRCRQMEEEEEENNNAPSAMPTNYERPSFQQWTLPPEEAIFNLMLASLPEPSGDETTSDNSIVEDGLGYLPSACPPTRTLVTEQEEETSNKHDSKQAAAANF